MKNIILQTHGISVKYGNFPALDDVSIRLKNNLTCIVGGVCSSGDRYCIDSNTLSFQKIRDKIRISLTHCQVVRSKSRRTAEVFLHAPDVAQKTWAAFRFS